MQYRKRPVMIEAEQFRAPVGEKAALTLYPLLGVYNDPSSSTGYSINTLEGRHEVTPGDYIITGVDGEKYPCKESIFLKTYVPADQPLSVNEINQEVKRLADTNEVSDGYHTFKELYEHRIALFISLTNVLDAIDWGNIQDVKSALGLKDKLSCWKSKLHHDGTMFEGWFIAGMGKNPGNQISYHLPLSEWENLQVEELERAPEWDGHSPQDALNRLRRRFMPGGSK